MRTIAGLMLLVTGCSAESSGTLAGPKATDSEATNDATSAGGDRFCTGANCKAAAPSTSSTPTADEGSCPASSKFIYVATNTVTKVSFNTTNSGPPITLWSYWPPTNELKKIGDPPCLAKEAIQNMTVDRNGFAWILGNSGTIYKVDTKDGSCVSSTPLKTHLYFPSIAFVGDTAKSLYVFGAPAQDGQDLTAQFSKLDTATGALEDVGAPAVGGPGSIGTMTANGNGNIFYLESAVRGTGTSGRQKLYEIEPSGAKVVDSYDVTTPMTLSGGNNTGLAYFGTQFYLFFDKAVHRLDPMTKTTTLVGAPSWSGVGVAGAGQSTCVANTAVAEDTAPPVVK